MSNVVAPDNLTPDRLTPADLAPGAVIAPAPADVPATEPPDDMTGEMTGESTGESMDESIDEPAELVIRPRRGWVAINWSELADRRELLYFLVWRDVKVRYKQTVLGVAWAVLQPLFSTFVFTLIFGLFARIPSDGVPYAVFSFCGLIPWTFFANGLSQAGQSLANQQQLLTKIYLPRLLVPTATVGVCLVDFAISAGVFALVLAGYWLAGTPVAVGWPVVFVPPLLLLLVLLTLGVGYLLAALTVSYRDFRYVIPFMVQAWMYLSPVVYPASLVPARFRWTLYLNPMAGLIDGFRAAVLGTPWDVPALAASAAITVAVFFLGALYFRKTERRFADVA